MFSALKLGSVIVMQCSMMGLEATRETVIVNGTYLSAASTEEVIGSRRGRAGDRPSAPFKHRQRAA
jgi:hypothetical protein